MTRPRKKPKQSNPVPWIAAIVAVGLVAYFAGRGGSSEPPTREVAQTPVSEAPAAQTQPPPARAASADWDPSWEPLPGRAQNPQHAAEIESLYAFVAKNPDIVRHMPCFCGCSRGGHTSVESCFITERRPNASPRWNPMGFG